MATILNVDDNALVRIDRKRILADAGFRVIDAANGGDALRIANSDLPNAVVLDVKLPDIHGFEVRRTLRSNPRTAHIPIVHVTAHVSEEEKEHALAEGAEALLIEPIHPDELIRAVSVALAHLRLGSIRRTVG